VKFGLENDREDINNFVKALPHKLKLEISLYIHEGTYKKLKCFKGRSHAFISWMCPLLQPQMTNEQQYIFMEGDDVTNIYFLVDGQCGYSLPKYDNLVYIKIIEGDFFGVIDIIHSIHKHEETDIDSWINHKDILRRSFSAISITNSELLTLSIQNFNRMRTEFQYYYD